MEARHRAHREGLRRGGRRRRPGRLRVRRSRTRRRGRLRRRALCDLCSGRGATSGVRTRAGARNGWWPPRAGPRRHARLGPARQPTGARLLRAARWGLRPLAADHDRVRHARGGVVWMAAARRRALLSRPSGDRLAELEWDLIAYSPQPAHMHMSLDEVLLQRVIAGTRRPTVRFWEWIEPALVIGSHQSVMNEVDVVAADELGFTVTRRMSGGGTMLCEPGRTITYSLYAPATAVAGLSFRQSYAALDAWAVRSFIALGVPASYREINDIISPRGKIAGAAQARRRGFLLHHTTIAHTMNPNLVPRLIRVGRDRLSERGVRSAEKPVSPLSWFTSMDCAGVARHMEQSFASDFGATESTLAVAELDAADQLVRGKYSTAAWINRLP